MRIRKLTLNKNWISSLFTLYNSHYQRGLIQFHPIGYATIESLPHLANGAIFSTRPRCRSFSSGPKFFNESFRDSDGHLRWRSAKRGETLSSLIAKRTNRFNDLFIRNGGRGLVNEFIKIHFAIRSRISSSSVLQIVMFSRKCHQIGKAQGFPGLCLYLKACQVLLQQSVGKYKVSDLTDLKCRPKRSKYGSPLIIHRSVRSKIHNNHDEFCIKLWMTLLGVYRVMNFKGELKLKTITEPFTVPDSILIEWTDFVNNKWKNILDSLSRGLSLPSMALRPISTTSPTSSVLRSIGQIRSVTSTHLASMWLSSFLWLQDKLYFEKLKDFSGLLGAPYFVERLRMIGTADPTFKEKVKDASSWAKLTILNQSPTESPIFWSSDSGKNWVKFKESNETSVVVNPVPYNKKVIWSQPTGGLAKLALKYEAAGKVRVFAMVDCWTQWVMEPLHKYIFSMLRRMDTDGTFNQTAPINNLIERFGYPKGFVPKRTFYSLDLSAATDRLPISLQKPIISLLYSISWGKTLGMDKVKCDEFSELWGSLLVDRIYYLSLSRKDFQKIRGLKHKVYRLNYAVGQPMGALSSWAMLAMTHHAIIAFCAYRAGIKDNFIDYAVLGDDVIIANSKVANAYLKFLSEIGVGVGLAKSLISKRRFVLEFAKKFFVDSKQMDMVPIKDCITTWTSTALVREFGHKWKMNLPATFSFLGVGYKAKSRLLTMDFMKVPMRNRVILVWITMPGNWHGFSTWAEWFCMVNAYNTNMDRDPEDFLNIVRRLSVAFEERIERYESILEKFEKSITSLSKKAEKDLPVVRSRMAEFGGGDFLEFIPFQIPMEKILLTPLTESSEYAPRITKNLRGAKLDFVGETQYHRHSDHVPVLLTPLSDNPLREKLAQIISTFEDTKSYIDSVLESGDEYEAIQAIDIIAQFLFGGNEFEDTVREDIWPDGRVVEKLFDDFNQIYKLFSTVTQDLRTPVPSSDASNLKETLKSEHTNTELSEDHSSDVHSGNSVRKDSSVPPTLPYNFFNWKIPRRIRRAESLRRTDVAPLIKEDGSDSVNKITELGPSPSKKEFSWFDVFWILISILINLFALSLLVSFSKNIFQSLRPKYKTFVDEELEIIRAEWTDWITWLGLLLLCIIFAYIGFSLWYSYSKIEKSSSVNLDLPNHYELENQALSAKISHFRSSTEELERSNVLLSDSIKQLTLEVESKTRDHTVVSSMLEATERKLSAYSRLLHEYRESNLELIHKGSLRHKELSDVNTLLSNANLEIERLRSQVVEFVTQANEVSGPALIHSIDCPNLEFLHCLGTVLDLRNLSEILNHITPEELNSQPSLYLADRYVDDLIRGISIIRDFYASHPDLSVYVELVTIN